MDKVSDQFGMLVTREALLDFIDLYGEEGAANELANGFKVAILEAIKDLKKEDNDD